MYFYFVILEILLKLFYIFLSYRNNINIWEKQKKTIKRNFYVQNFFNLAIVL